MVNVIFQVMILSLKKINSSQNIMIQLIAIFMGQLSLTIFMGQLSLATSRVQISFASFLLFSYDSL